MTKAAFISNSRAKVSSYDLQVGNLTRTRIALNSGNGEEKLENEWDGFNPFKRQTQNPVNSVLESSTQSLRKIRMGELMNELFQNSLEDDKKIRDILSQNKALLLDPLINDEAVQDEDSIYAPGMTREARFDRYSEVVQERENNAVNASVKRILRLMREFVLEYKEDTLSK